ncbi:serine/threonine-protein phosphatase 7 long form homolog [Salvia splendens]|uniref:serine/threonine-protein phosphatase 7 long form homolog n=1 Tax=Salvia splendens TaxID=180675 RepID=UPI001C27ECB7|nr:serine/threonine-protein phosphatase 7 long form homolog [Salvia splendens]
MSRYGPEDPSVLHYQHSHISRKAWAGEETSSFNIRRFEGHFWEIDNHHRRVIDYVCRFDFGGVFYCGKALDVDHSLITALVERWRPETHTFHLPVGEATITLQDVQVLWALRVDGAPFTGSGYCDSGWRSLCEELLGFYPLQSEMKENGILASALIHRMMIEPLQDDLEDEAYIRRARMIVLVLLGGLILPDGSGCKIPLMWLTQLRDVESASMISWASAALATLYHNLCEASMGKRTDIGGPTVLLQLWVWERMPTLRPDFVMARMHTDNTPCAFMWTGSYMINRAPKHSVRHYREQLSLLQNSQFIWMPYVDRQLPDSCLEMNNLWRSVTYMVCWAIVEAHEPERVVRQFGGTPFIPELRDWGFNETHFKTNRRGKAKTNWAVQNKTYIQHWERRSEFVTNHYMEPLADHVQVMRTRQYMEWYFKITIAYITQPGRLPEVGMNTVASSSTLQSETLARVFHLSRGFDPEDAVGLLHEINSLALNCLTDCGESERTVIPSTQRTDVDMSRGFIRRARGIGQRGIRTGGHGYSRHSRMSQDMPGSSQAGHEENVNSDDNIDLETFIDNFAAEPEMQNPPAPDPSSWFPTWSDAPQSSWVTPFDRVGIPWQPTTQDSFFSDVHIVHSSTNDADDDADDDDADDDGDDGDADADVAPRSSVQLDRPSSSSHTAQPDKERARTSLSQTILGMFPRRRSSRDNRGKGPSKYTPSSFK